MAAVCSEGRRIVDLECAPIIWSCLRQIWWIFDPDSPSLEAVLDLLLPVRASFPSGMYASHMY